MDRCHYLKLAPFMERAEGSANVGGFASVASPFADAADDGTGAGEQVIILRRGKIAIQWHNSEISDFKFEISDLKAVFRQLTADR